MVRVSMEQFLADIDRLLEHVETSGESIVVISGEGTRFELKSIADDQPLADASSGSET